MISVFKMVSWLGIDVVFQGIETGEQKEFLISIGGLYGQGFYYSKPMTINNYIKCISENINQNEMNITNKKVKRHKFDIILP